MTNALHLFNETQQASLGRNIKVANNPLTRFMGLMLKRTLNDGEGLWIKPCNSIHMFWMLIPLDVIFLDKDNTIVGVLENIRPWRVSKLYKGAKSALELPVGTVQKTRSSLDDRVVIVTN